MTADPVRPQETLRDRIASAIGRNMILRKSPAEIADAVLPIVEEETKALRDEVQEYRNAICWDVTCFNCSHLLDRCYEADMQRAALRDKVKALADECDSLATAAFAARDRRVAQGLDATEEDRIAVVEGFTLRKAAHRLRALVEEPQGGEQ